MLRSVIGFFLENRLVTLIFLVLVIGWGIATAPFQFDRGLLPSLPVPVDAIPDIGENQQIVYTEWAGRSPMDVESQVSYPLTTALLGISGVKTIRSNSIMGLSTVYIIFDDDVEFYWSRTRILEKLNSLPEGTLPEGVRPALGPDATALGQVYWYTLEGRDSEGNPAGGWDPQELRTIQDFYVRYSLASVRGVGEVASIGGFVKEYQIDIDPRAMRAYDITIAQVMDAVRKSNLDIGARTIEWNRVEYLVRVLGYIQSLSDIEESTITVRNHVPIRIKDIARVVEGPATRRGGLDKGGAEAVGGVIVARYGANPLEVIQEIKKKIDEVSSGLPEKKLEDGTTSRVTIVPFYDRTNLIQETLGTLNEALTLEILISIIVVILLIVNLRASILIAGILPLGVLATFVFMKYFEVSANIVALSGIAIAIGVMVDVGVVLVENIVLRLEQVPRHKTSSKVLLQTIGQAVGEVAPAIITALSTTIVSFFPVFAMEAAEGKLFRPLAMTKTFAMISALIVGLLIIPGVSYLLFSGDLRTRKFPLLWNIFLIILGVVSSFFISWGWVLIVLGGLHLLRLNGFFLSKHSDKETPLLRLFSRLSSPQSGKYFNVVAVLGVIVYLLAVEWMPLGVDNGMFINSLFVFALVAIILGLLMYIVKIYPRLLMWILCNRWKFLSLPFLLFFVGLLAWLGWAKIFSFLPQSMQEGKVWDKMVNFFPGLGKEFMPALDEGEFLLMPTTMPHSGIEENLEVIRHVDKNLNDLPEVRLVVGKWGRVLSALDPAPVSMYENIISYYPEYMIDKYGEKMRFKTDDEGNYLLKDGTTYHPKSGFRRVKKSELIPDKEGAYFRQWRSHIHSADDIWQEIVKRTTYPGLTSAPKLQPIQTRLVMLQTGMRAPMGMKVFGKSLEDIGHVSLQMEALLKEVRGVEPASVFADRVVGKPYLEVKLDRKRMALYGIKVGELQQLLSGAIGGRTLTTTVEGRERYPVRVRYAREFRDNPQELMSLPIPTKQGENIPLGEVAKLHYRRGPQMIRSENTYLTGYVIFDKKDNFAEVDVVVSAEKRVRKALDEGELQLPPGSSYKFTGSYENELRASKRLQLLVPLSLIIIFLILFFQFRSATASTIVFSGVFLAFSGAFLMLWLYAQPWFMDFTVAGIHMRDLFAMKPLNMSVAVWVGFIALFGIATDDGVLMGTYLKQAFERDKPKNREEIRQAILKAGQKRVRPAMMTTATTLIALLPVLSSTGKGSDIMVPMAIPSFGGMVIQGLTIFLVPVLYSFWKERTLLSKKKGTSYA